MSLGNKLQITPELINTVKQMAYNGLTQSDIAEVFKRDRNTIFYNTQDENKDVLSAYNEGKAKNKADLMKRMENLSSSADSEQVQFNATKYSLNVKHRVIEQQKAELTGKDGDSLIPTAIVIKGLEKPEPDNEQ